MLADVKYALRRLDPSVAPAGWNRLRLIVRDGRVQGIRRYGSRSSARRA